MSDYENEYSNFPEELITLHEFENVDDSIAAIINQINTLRDAGNYAAASNLMTANEDTLEHYLVDATTFRTWEEEIYNTQVYAKKKSQDIYFTDDEPDGCDEDDVWISSDGDDSTDASYDTGYSVGYSAGYSAGYAYANSITTTSSKSYTAGYSAGYEAANDEITESSASYQSGYSAGYADGYADASGTFAVHTATVSSSGTTQTITYTAEGTVLCAGVMTAQYQVADYDEDDTSAYREMTAYVTCSFSGSTITLTVDGGNQSSLERSLTATISYAVLT